MFYGIGPRMAIFYKLYFQTAVIKDSSHNFEMKNYQNGHFFSRVPRLSFTYGLKVFQFQIFGHFYWKHLAGEGRDGQNHNEGEKHQKSFRIKKKLITSLEISKNHNVN